MKQIPLTQGYAALVDDEDYEELSKHKWYAHVTRSGSVAVRNSSGSKGKRTTIYMSRQITDAPSNMDVDHKDHNTLNNQRSNLRICTTSQNMGNSCKRIGCSSQFKGVSWNKNKKKWSAYIGAAGRDKHLGYFDDEAEAARRYNVEAVQEFGEFALLNVILKEGHCAQAI